LECGSTYKCAQPQRRESEAHTWVILCPAIFIYTCPRKEYAAASFRKNRMHGIVLEAGDAINTPTKGIKRGVV